MMLCVIRHGSTTWNEEGRIQGRQDIPLSARGQAQVRAWTIERKLAASAPWVSSPLRRARETAQLLSGRELMCDDALLEMDWGGWEGFTLAELRTREPDFACQEARGLDFQPPCGESPRDVQDRVLRWLRRISPGPDAMVAVTHKGVIRALLAAASGWDMTCKPPIRLADDRLHRFTVEDDGTIAIAECNVPLALEGAVVR